MSRFHSCAGFVFGTLLVVGAACDPGTVHSEGDVVGELPEQMPYLEWLHSDFREEKSCQDCHMPAVG